MIKVKFSKGHKMRNLETFEFTTYKAFFEWYMLHKNKGYIYGEIDDGGTA